MNLSLKELNELVYCVGVAIRKGELINLDVANELYDRLNSEIESRVNESESIEDDDEEIAWPGKRTFSTYLDAVISAEDAFGVDLNVTLSELCDNGDFSYEDVDGNLIYIYQKKGLMVTEDETKEITIQEFVNILGAGTDYDLSDIEEGSLGQFS